MAQISVSDLQGGVYGVQDIGQTAQNLSQAPPVQANPAAQSVPDGYSSWAQMIQEGRI
jgi:hypothetical protein